MKSKSLIFGIFVAALLTATPNFVQAANPPALKQSALATPDFTLSANEAVVMDSRTGKVLFEKNADAPWPAASLAKLMSAVVFVEQKPVLSRLVSITAADEVGGGRLRVAAGTKMTLKDIFYSALVGSANNAAMNMMRNSGLSRVQFIDLMNVRAATLGMSSSKYYEPTGMDPRNTVSARDMAKLARHAFDNPLIQKTAQTAKYQFKTSSPVINKTIKNTNALLLDPNNDLWVVAGKTGFIDEAQYNLAVRVKTMRKDKDVVVVVLGADTKQKSFDETEKLAKWAWQNYVW